MPVIRSAPACGSAARDRVTRDAISLDEAVYSPGEMRLVVDTPDLPTLQQHAMDLGRERNFKARITRMRRSKAWGDLGDLKRELLDLWTEERNTLAKQVMQEIEAQRKGAGR